MLGCTGDPRLYTSDRKKCFKNRKDRWRKDSSIESLRK
jgi:hypothetical protein